MAWIRTIPPAEAQGALAREYDAGMARAGKVYQILQVQSLAAPTLAASMQLYLAAMRGRSELSRLEREMLAVVVSRLNDCFY